MKTCSKCKTEQPLSSFTKDANRKDGLDPHCRACKSIKFKMYAPIRPKQDTEKMKEWRAANKDQANQNRKSWYAANPDAWRIQAHNRRARKRENGGKLTNGLADKLFKLQRGKCACCGANLVDNHMDHVIPVALGGPNEDWNMQLLCAPCNLSKGAKHPVDFMQQRGFLI